MQPVELQLEAATASTSSNRGGEEKSQIFLKGSQGFPAGPGGQLPGGRQSQARAAKGLCPPSSRLPQGDETGLAREPRSRTRCLFHSLSRAPEETAEARALPLGFGLVHSSDSKPLHRRCCAESTAQPCCRCRSSAGEQESRGHRHVHTSAEQMQADPNPLTRLGGGAKKSKKGITTFFPFFICP